MRTKLVFLLIVAVLAVLSTSTAFAASGSCPPGFTLEEMMPHEDHEHMHVGIKTDLNGDGYICMKPVTPGSDIHVHVDNYLP